MAEVQPLPIDKAIDKASEDFKNELEKDFKEITDKVKNEPNKINKIDEDAMNNLDKYLQLNPAKATETLLNVLDAIKDPENKLGSRDKKSLGAIKDLIISKKYSSETKVGEYQLNSEVFKDFKFEDLQKYGKDLFQKGGNTDRFKNIPENYDGKNEKVNKLFSEGEFKDMYFTSEQFVKGLYDKNTERINNLVKDMNSYNIIKFITDNQTATKPIDVEEILKGNTDVYKNFPNMAGYREFDDLKNNEKTNGFLAEWNKKIEVKTTSKDVEIIENRLSTIDEMLNKYKGEDKNSVIKFNKSNPNSKFNDIINLIKNDKDNPKTNVLVKLLNKGDLKGFQKEVYGDILLNRSNFGADGKFGKETFEKTAIYLSGDLVKIQAKEIDLIPNQDLKSVPNLVIDNKVEDRTVNVENNPNPTKTNNIVNNGQEKLINQGKI